MIDIWIFAVDIVINTYVYWHDLFGNIQTRICQTQAKASFIFWNSIFPISVL